MVIKIDGIEKNVIDGSKFNQEEAKNLLRNHQAPSEIGDLLTKWEADELRTKGVFVSIPEKDVLADIKALKLADPNAKKIIDKHLVDKEKGFEFNYFKETQTGAVYAFKGNPENTCAFAGYKLMYFKK